MRFYAYHGVLPQEQAVGNWFVVDLALKVDVTPATRSDQLSDTLNYAEIYALVEKEMRQPSALLEHAAGRIIRRLGERAPLPKQKVASVSHPLTLATFFYAAGNSP